MQIQGGQASDLFQWLQSMQLEKYYSQLLGKGLNIENLLKGSDEQLSMWGLALGPRRKIQARALKVTFTKPALSVMDHASKQQQKQCLTPVSTISQSCLKPELLPSAYPELRLPSCGKLGPCIDNSARNKGPGRSSYVNMKSYLRHDSPRTDPSYEKLRQAEAILLAALYPPCPVGSLPQDNKFMKRKLESIDLRERSGAQDNCLQSSLHTNTSKAARFRRAGGLWQATSCSSQISPDFTGLIVCGGCPLPSQQQHSVSISFGKVQGMALEQLLKQQNTFTGVSIMDDPRNYEDYIISSNKGTSVSQGSLQQVQQPCQKHSREQKMNRLARKKALLEELKSAEELVASLKAMIAEVDQEEEATIITEPIVVSVQEPKLEHFSCIDQLVSEDAEWAAQGRNITAELIEILDDD